MAYQNALDLYLVIMNLRADFYVHEGATMENHWLRLGDLPLKRSLVPIYSPHVHCQAPMLTRGFFQALGASGRSSSSSAESPDSKLKTYVIARQAKG